MGKRHQEVYVCVCMWGWVCGCWWEKGTEKMWRVGLVGERHQEVPSGEEEPRSKESKGWWLADILMGKSFGI